MTNYPTYRYYIIVSGTETEVFPVNTVKFKEERDSEQYFYRLSIDGTMEFQDRTGISDFTFLKAYETTFNYLNLRVDKNNGSNVYTTYLNSYLSLKGEWLNDQYKCKLGTKINDVYTIIDKYGDKEFNLLQSGLSQSVIDCVIKGVTYNYEKSIKIIDALEYIYQNISGTSGSSLTSQFFNSATNPVTEATSETDNIFICPKNVLIDVGVEIDLYLSTITVFAQTFTVGENALTLDTIKLQLYRILSPTGNVAISIWETDNDGLPTGAVLATELFPATDLPTDLTGVYKTITMSDQPVLTALTKYSIVIACTGVDATNKVVAKGIETGLYSDGDYCIYSGAAWIKRDPLDLIFKISDVNEGEVIVNEIIQGDETIMNASFNSIMKILNNTYLSSF